MAGLKALVFFLVWLVWVAVIPFIVLASFTAWICHICDEKWKPWIRFEVEPDP